MGRIITLNEGLYNYEVPLKEPSDEKDIINHEYSKKTDQFWRTPKPVDVKRLSQSERIKFIEKERQRWDEGVYVLINGELRYFTGMYYDFLTYMTYKGQRPTFFTHQCEDFYFRDLCRKDQMCRGMLWVKPRRYSMTMQEICQATYELNSNLENNIGLQSDTDKKTVSTLLTPLINSYVKRPKYMRSDYYKPNGKMLVSRLVLSSNLAPDENGVIEGDYLDGWIRPFPALPRAMDGEQLWYIVMDEAWKWLASPKETYESNKLVTSGFGRNGKISVLSTMGDSDDYIRSVMDGMDMIAKSNPNIRDENGYTITGLYKRFVSAVYSFEIPEHIFEYDKFGNVNVDKHRDYILAEINKHPKDSSQYIFAKRRLPLEEKDALLSASNQFFFSKMRMSERMDEIRQQMPNEKPLRGFIDQSYSGICGIEEDENGIWLFDREALPYVDASRGIDTRNRFKQQNGFYYPVKNPEYFASIDPIRYKKEDTKSRHLSRYCGLIHKKFDYFNSGIQNRYAAMLLYRPDDPRDGNREMAKACKFFGSPCMYERNIPTPKEDFMALNMLPFMLLDKDKIHGMLMTSNKRNVQEGIDMLVSRFKPPQEGEQDQLMQIPFIEMLLDMDNFDIADTTKFDVMMAMILLEHGEKQFTLTNTTDNSIGDMIKTLHEFLPKRR